MPEKPRLTGAFVAFLPMVRRHCDASIEKPGSRPLMIDARWVP
jgi:hypothetical protein